MTHTHVAGSIHADVAARAPGWLAVPADVNALLPAAVERDVGKDADGVLTVAGLSVTEIAEQVGTPVYVVDEDDLRARARDFATAFAGWDVYYAGKSFLCTAVARWVARRASASTSAPAASWPWPCGPGSICAGSACTATTRAWRSSGRRLDAGVGRIIVDSFDEIARLGDLAAELGVRPRVMVRVTTGVEAHTHEYIATAHEDQKFGFSIAGGAAAEALRPATSSRRWSWPASTPTSVRRSSTPRASRSPPDGRCGCTPSSPRRTGVELPELDLGGGFGIAYTSTDSPATPNELATALRRDHRARVRGAGHRRPAPVDRARSGDQRSERLRPLPGGHRQAGPARRREPAGSTSPWTAG